MRKEDENYIKGFAEGYKKAMERKEEVSKEAEWERAFTELEKRYYTLILISLISSGITAVGLYINSIQISVFGLSILLAYIFTQLLEINVAVYAAKWENE